MSTDTDEALCGETFAFVTYAFYIEIKKDKVNLTASCVLKVDLFSI